MKPLILIAAFLVSITASAQTIKCQPHGQALYKKLEMNKPDYSYDVPWYSVHLDNQYNQRQIFTVNPQLLKDRLQFLATPDRNDLIVNFGKYKGPGIYHSVKITLRKGTPREETASLMCELPADFAIQSVCQNEKSSLQAFFQAATNRDLNQMESAMACDVDANAKNEFGCTALLLSADPFCGQNLPSPMPYNPMRGALPILDFLTNNGALLELKDPANNERALHKFAKLGDLDAVSLLLDLEANVDAQDLKGFTPLMRAVEVNNKYLVQRIVEAGPDFDLKNKEGETALAIAKKLGFKKLEPLLQAPSVILEFKGQSNGTCLPLEGQLNLNKLGQIKLKATEDEMFLLEIPGLGVSLMADAGEEVSQNLVPARAGIYPFTCGVHGAQTQTTGQITVE